MYIGFWTAVFWTSGYPAACGFSGIGRRRRYSLDMDADRRDFLSGDSAASPAEGAGGDRRGTAAPKSDEKPPEGEKCPRCGAFLPPAASFCGKCGLPTGGVSAASDSGEPAEKDADAPPKRARWSNKRLLRVLLPATAAVLALTVLAGVLIYNRQPYTYMGVLTLSEGAEVPCRVGVSIEDGIVQVESVLLPFKVAIHSFSDLSFDQKKMKLSHDITVNDIPAALVLDRRGKNVKKMTAYEDERRKYSLFGFRAEKKDLTRYHTGRNDCALLERYASCIYFDTAEEARLYGCTRCSLCLNEKDMPRKTKDAGELEEPPESSSIPDTSYSSSPSVSKTPPASSSPASSSYSAYSNDEPDDICQVGGCSQTVYNGKCCFDHICHYVDSESYIACVNQAIDGRRYCKEHLCGFEGCGNMQEEGESYCYWHRCGETGCHNARIDDRDHYAKGFCSEHTCILSGCTSGKANDTSYCYSHLCSSWECRSPIKGNDNNYNYCEDHNCKESNCTNASEVGDEFCYLHNEVSSSSD